MLLHICFPYIYWPNNWRGLVFIPENFQHEMGVVQVNRFKPPSSLVKLNTNGGEIENPGKMGADGILRDHNTRLIYAFATPLSFGSNNQVEV